MQVEIIDRVIEEGLYIKNTCATVRSTATVFNQSKSTIHKDVTERLKQVDYELYLDVKKVLNINYNERHIRGGNATKLKYQRLRKNV